jgi:hypothetical protein
MRETMIRRLLVFVLCASGVVALWIVADRSVPGPDSAVSATPGTRQSGGDAAPDRDESPRRPDADGASRGPSSPGGADHPPSTDQPADERSSPPSTLPDHRPPHRVRGLHVVDNTYEAVTVGWAESNDGGGIAYYEVTLNGIAAGATAGRQLTIDWFNDDMNSHFVQVRAVDRAGNRSKRGEPLMVNRPEPPASADPAADTPDPEPTGPQPESPAPTTPPQTAAPPDNAPPDNPPPDNVPPENEPPEASPSPDPTSPPTSPSPPDKSPPPDPTSPAPTAPASPQPSGTGPEAIVPSPDDPSTSPSGGASDTGLPSTPQPPTSDPTG